MENKMMNEWITNYEKTMNTWMDNITKNQNFVKNFMKTYEPVMNVNKTLKETQEKFYENMGIVTKSDMTKLTQKVHDVEIKLSDISEELEDLKDGQKKIIDLLLKKATVKKATVKKNNNK